MISKLFDVLFQSLPFQSMNKYSSVSLFSAFIVEWWELESPFSFSVMVTQQPQQ